MNFIDKLISRLDTINSHVCVGLDSRYDQLPEALKKGASITDAIFTFNKHVIEATNHLAIAYKTTLAFYKAFGPEALEGLRLTNEYIKSKYPGIVLLADDKTSYMDESAKMVKKEIFDWLLFDCVMMTPWFGYDTVKEFIADPTHGVAIYVHDSNRTAVDFQDLELKDGRKVYEVVAENIVNKWNTSGNVFVEAGATYPEQLKRTREIVGEDMVILTAGLGPQGGTVENLRGQFGKNKKRLIANSSRAIIFAGKDKKDYFQEVKNAAEYIRDELLKGSEM